MKAWIAGGALMGLLGCGGEDAASGDPSGGETEGGDGDSAGDGDGDSPGDGDTSGDGDEPACSETCPGCCAGTVCVETPTDDECGRPGQACAACDSWQECQGSDPDSLAFGTCTPVASSTWTITINSVSAYAQKEGPDDWDAFDAPDLKVCLLVSEVEISCTSECTDAYSCSLDQTVGSVTYEEVEAGTVTLIVYDVDALDDDDYGGGVLLETSDLEMGGFTFESELNYGFEELSATILHE